MATQVEFRKTRDFGELIGDTFPFIKQNFKPLMKAFIYLCGIFIVGAMLSTILVQLQMVGFTQGYGTSRFINNPALFFSLIGAQYILLVLFSILSYVSVYLTVLSYIALYVEKGNVAPSVEEVWSYFKFYFLRVLGSGFVVSLFAGICFLCCVIPGIYVFPMISLFFPVMIMENGTFSYTFDRSFKLVKEEWWATAGVLLIIWVITYACTMLFQLPAIVISLISAFTHGQMVITKTYAIVTSVFQYVSQVFMIIPLICSTLCYFNLVERKENSGLLNRIDQLGKNPDDANTHPEEY